MIAKERLPKQPLKGFAPIVPDAVLEVRSPRDSMQKVSAKIERWLAAGVKLAWEIDPDTRTLTVYRTGQPPRLLKIDDTLSGEDVLPGFLLPLTVLFASLETQEATEP